MQTEPTPTTELRQLLLAEFGWQTSSRFTGGELQTILSAGRDIRSFVEGVMPGQGAAWMTRWLSALRFHSQGLPQRVVTFFNRAPTSLVFPFRDIWFVKDLDHFRNPRQHVTHEIGHVLDNRSGGWLPSIWFGRGDGDKLARFVGGKPARLRWINGSVDIPNAHRWTQPEQHPAYGDHSTADYFAEAFTWAIYDPGRCPHPGMVTWLKERIRAMLITTDQARLTM